MQVSTLMHLSICRYCGSSERTIKYMRDKREYYERQWLIHRQRWFSVLVPSTDVATIWNSHHVGVYQNIQPVAAWGSPKPLVRSTVVEVVNFVYEDQGRIIRLATYPIRSNSWVLPMVPVHETSVIDAMILLRYISMLVLSSHRHIQT